MRRLPHAAVLVVAQLLSPQLAAADDPRPSLERIEAANCAKADVDGDSYRPIYCEARCDCPVAAAALAAADACGEAAPGHVQVTQTLSGSCVDQGLGLFACALALPLACLGDSDCPAEYPDCDAGVCETNSLCSGPGDACPSATVVYAEYLGVGSPDTLGPVTCARFAAPTSPAINSNDALACLLEVEGQTGLDCP